MSVEKLDSLHVRFRLAQPYAAAERIFDSLAILPRHLLEKPWHEGKLSEAWSLNAAPGEIAGMGPFRLKEYVPGEKIVLEKNPYYWKTDRNGTRLPYLDQLEFRVRAVRRRPDTSVHQRRSRHFEPRGSPKLRDAAPATRAPKPTSSMTPGPGLEYNFLFFNLGTVDAQRFPEIAARQAWFRDVAFRQAISAAVDRDAIVHLVYGGRAAALWGHVTPANRLWLNTTLPKPPQSLERARRLLKDRGFHWTADGTLVDSTSKPVEFSIVVSSSSPERAQMATVIQEDLKKLGLHVQVVSLEFRALIDRVLNSRQYEACILGLVSGDADPNPEMNVWLSSGGSHLWNPNQEIADDPLGGGD